MAIAQNIVINNDADYSQQFIAKTDAGTVIDLTTYTITAMLRKTYGSTAQTDFTTAKVVATDGTFTLALTDTKTKTGTLERGRHVYDVTITAAGGEITRIQEGIATVSPSVTRTA